MLSVLATATVLGGAWFVLGRGDGAPSSEFARAEQRYVNAAESLSTAAAGVTFGRGDPVYQVEYETSRSQMELQVAVFERIAGSEEGEAADVASEAARSAKLGVRAAESLSRALFRTDISDADLAREQLDDAVRELERSARAWQQL